jgi:gamma-glutamylcyclotransferase
MCSGRLKARISCKVVTIGRLAGHRLSFQKVSKDGSSKCDAFRTGSEADVVWGVVFEIPAQEKPKLDRVEGLGSGYEDA